MFSRCIWIFFYRALILAKIKSVELATSFCPNKLSFQSQQTLLSPSPPCSWCGVACLPVVRRVCFVFSFSSPFFFWIWFLLPGNVVHSSIIIPPFIILSFSCLSSLLKLLSQYLLIEFSFSFLFFPFLSFSFLFFPFLSFSFLFFPFLFFPSPLHLPPTPQPTETSSQKWRLP